jgi:hypothetical protein
MNLEQELRAVLSQEAEMRTTPTPDIERMVTGGQGRLRRRNTIRIGLAAAAVLLLGGGLYGVAQIGDGDSDAGVAAVPSESADATNLPSWPDNDAPVDAGSYQTHVGVAADGTRIDADLTIGGSGWTGSNFPVAYDGQHFAGIGAYQAESVAGGCKMAAGLEPAATEPQQLAQQLTGMPRSEVVQQPTPTTASGYDAVHLQLRVDALCGDDNAYYQVAKGVAAAGGRERGISYFENREAVSGIVIIDFWVVDVDGTTVVVDMFRSDGAPKTLVDQATAARESITLVQTK